MKRRKRIACVATLVIATGCGRSAVDYLDRGNKLAGAQKFPDAVLEYKKAIQKDPILGEAYYQLALADERCNQPLEALQALTKAVELLPQSEAAMTKLGDLSFDAFLGTPSHPKELYDTAAKMADRLLAKNPLSFNGFRLKGRLALADQRPDQALNYLQRAAAIQPRNRDVVLGLVQALIQVNRFPEAEQLASRTLDADQDFALLYDVLYRYYLATNRRPDAEKILQAKVEKNPKEALYTLQLAEFYAARKDSDRMTQTLQRLLGNSSDFPQARLLVGDFYTKLGDLDAALHQFEAGAAANSKDKAAYQVRISKVLVAEGKPDEALRVLDSTVKDRPDDDIAATEHATVLLGSKDTEHRSAAIREFKELVRRKPKAASFHYNLALALVLNGEIESAKPELREAIRLQKPFDIAKFLLANIALAQNNPGESLRLSEEMIPANPEDPAARLVRTQSLMRLGRYLEARAELDHLVRQYPQSWRVQLQVGALAVLEKRYSDAAKILEQLRGSGPGELPATFGLAETYSRQNEFDKAIQLLSAELNRSQDGTVRRMLAETALRAGRYDLAITEYGKLLSADPKSDRIRIQLGEAYAGKADWNGAIRLFGQAREMAPQNLEAAFSLANALYNAGRPSDALAAYRDLVAHRPDDADALNDLAFMLCETGGNAGEAVKLAQRAVQKSPDNEGFLDTLGWAYVKSGSSADAIQVLRNLVRRKPENPSFRFHYGAALLAKGDKATGRAELQAALERKPQSGEEKNIREMLARAN